jgi:prepilin-type N-terminal cleavage/methylation domain-containing protein
VPRLVDQRKGRRNTGRQPLASAGFTLIEVMLALMIFALMGGILYGAFSLGHSAVEKSETNSTRNQKQRAMADLLGNYVRSGFPYRESAQDQTVYFAGEIDSVSFVSAYSQAMGGRGMAKIQITKQEDGNGRAVLKLEETAPVRINSETGIEAGAAGQTHSIVLQSDIRELRLGYLDPQAEDEKWEDRWDGAERRRLPRAVRLSYLNDAGKEVSWVFPIMMTVLAQ